MSNCPECGKNLALVGRVHRCIPIPKVNNVTLLDKPKPALLTKSPADRQSKWREANPDINRQRAKDGMRKLRARRNGTDG